MRSSAAPKLNQKTASDSPRLCSSRQTSKRQEAATSKKSKASSQSSPSLYAKSKRTSSSMSIKALRSQDLDDAFSGMKFTTASKLLPTIVTRTIQAQQQQCLYPNYPPNAVNAAKAFDQLAATLNELPAENNVNAYATTSAGPPSTQLVSLSNPTSRNNSFAALPRHLSDPTLLSVPPSMNLGDSREIRRRVVKLCLELKRLLDKEGISFTPIAPSSNAQSSSSSPSFLAVAVLGWSPLVSDSPLHKVFFNKNCPTGGVAVLFKCLKQLPDVDICIVITNLLFRIMHSGQSASPGPTSTSQNAVDSYLSSATICGGSIYASTGTSSTSSNATNGNLTLMAKRGAGLALVSALSGISKSCAKYFSKDNDSTSTASDGNNTLLFKSNFNPPISPSGAVVPGTLQRIDEAFVNLFNILVRIWKYDSKLPVLTRLHGVIEIATETVKRWIERRKENGYIIVGLQLLRLIALRNDTNAQLIQKKNMTGCIYGFMKNSGVWGPNVKEIKDTACVESSIELLVQLAKQETIVPEIVKIFPISFLTGLFKSLTGNDALRKSILKLLKAIVETSYGRKEFNCTDGFDVLTSTLEELIQQNEVTISFTSMASNTIPSLLIGVLRAAVSEADLPHLQLLIPRTFEVPTVPIPPSHDVAWDMSAFTGPILEQTKTLDSKESSAPTSPSCGRKKKLTSPSKSKEASLSKQSSQLSIDLSISFSEKQETVYLRSLCPEFDMDSGAGQRKSNSMAISQIPIRILKSIYPTTFEIPSVSISHHRDPADYRPSVKMVPVGSTVASTDSILSNGQTKVTSQSSTSRYWSLSPREAEPQCKKSASILRKILYEQTSRMLRPTQYSSIVVYDVMNPLIAEKALSLNPTNLRFESRFESGNLQLAIKVQENEFDLLLQSDLGTKIGRHNQWFYFSVSNLSPSVTYKFNIINMSKGSSQFGEGMQPVIYSQREKIWRRGGEGICFYKNHYRKSERNEDQTCNHQTSSSGSVKSSTNATYSTLTFHIRHLYQDDTLYIAYHYPYTVSDLTTFLDTVQLKNLDSAAGIACDAFSQRCRRQSLCYTLGGNKVELLTITAFDATSLIEYPIHLRTYIFLTSRVHPGESNSSYIMQGSIRFLLSDDEAAILLRRKCVFKIVPMLNPDGVIAGNHRCGLAGTDLNRAWQSPCPLKNPTIYWTKMLWKYLVDNGKRPLLYCDFHGHSKKKNVFLFGCENTDGINEGIEKIFPSLLASVNPFFDPSNCKYAIEKSKEATARVVMWREMGIVASYTLESTYCGADLNENRGLQIQIPDLEKVGVDFCSTLCALIGIFDGKVPVTSPPISKKDKWKEAPVSCLATPAIADEDDSSNDETE